MRNQIKLFCILFLSMFSLVSYAITVSVQSSGAVSALGFTVNGKSHGGAGTSYSKSGLPSGIYSFGIRVNGVFGNDIGCATRQGKKMIRLDRDTTATLNYDGRRCTLQLS